MSLKSAIVIEPEHNVSRLMGHIFEHVVNYPHMLDVNREVIDCPKFKNVENQ